MRIPDEILNRKGVRKATDIPQEVLELLENGRIETVNLTEWLAVDQLRVLRNVLDELGLNEHVPAFEAVVNAQKKPTANSSSQVIGRAFGEMAGRGQVLGKLKAHPSDIVRCWACWADSTNNETTADLLRKMKPYAADRHFGVREVVIFASKDRLAADLSNSISLLHEWCTSDDDNVRRYVAEVLRPNGVWTKKVDAFHQNPELGLPLISPLKSDPSKYVQNSVANWLNDASKSNPDWVKQLCQAWEDESNSPETAYIVKRALRTINK
ncbi:MAG: DNA alkylation repair protein [Bacteroidota bacterium]